MAVWEAMMTSLTGKSSPGANLAPASQALMRACPRTSFLTWRARLRRGFTLVELILVMALLVIALGIAFPALQRFFRGRNLNAEAHRFLALVRYGQSQAVASGIPMQLWINPTTAQYGLQPAPGFLDNPRSVRIYSLHPGLEMELPPDQNRTLNMAAAGLAQPLSNPNEPIIGFRPDGSIIESSPTQVVVRDQNDQVLWIVQDPMRQTYAIAQLPPH